MKIEGLAMEDDTTVTLGTGKKGGKHQGTIKIEKGTMKLKVRLPFPKCSTSTLSSILSTEHDEPVVKKKM